jgi:hypothetical protein
MRGIVYRNTVWFLFVVVGLRIFPALGIILLEELLIVRELRNVVAADPNME